MISSFHYVKFPLLLASFALLFKGVAPEHLIAINIALTVPYALFCSCPIDAFVATALAATVYLLRAPLSRGDERPFWCWAAVYSFWNVHFAIACLGTKAYTAWSMVAVPLLGAAFFSLYKPYNKVHRDACPSVLFVWTVLRIGALLTVYTLNCLKLVSLAHKKT